MVPHAFDQQFHQAVDRLRVPAMGTEAVAPLLAALVGFLRPRRVLEIGMGYTTPFLAAALAGVRGQVAAETGALAAKSQRYLAAGAPLGEDWLNAEPALVAPGFYRDGYAPSLVAIDDLSIPESSAPEVQRVLAELGLADLVTVVNADLRDCADRLPAGFVDIDFAWIDAWECLYFFDHFWELINPDGGLVAMHYLLTYPEGEALLRYIGKFQEAHPGELEMVNLLEPHKLTQNSLTVLRRTGGCEPRHWSDTGGEVRYDDALHADARAQLEANDALRDGEEGGRIAGGPAVR
jgi:predicted O-methyltransferase YrrM